MDHFTPARLSVDLSAVADNYRLFQTLAGQAAVAGILKADAYGTGAKPVFEILVQAGCRLFFVATPDEALTLRALNAEVEIAVLGGVYTGAAPDYAHHRFIPVLNSREEMVRWQAQASAAGQALPSILHFDTGMNRLGFGAGDAHALFATPSLLQGLDVHWVMSHFACSDEAGHPMNEAQACRFANIAQHFPNARKSLANSSGLFRDKAWHYDMVRPGYALYGGNPTPEAVNPVKSVVKLEARILQTYTIRKGESAGYGASHVFEKDTECATLSIGYADGFLRSASNHASLYWQGQACPIRGRVSMDLTIVETGHLQGPHPQPGDWLEVIGPHQSVDDLAASCGTIGYEILTSLGPRYHRLYQG